MEIRKKTYVLAVAVIVILFGVAIGLYILNISNIGQKTGAPVQKVRFAITKFLGAAQDYVGIEKGYFKEEGLEISFQSFITGKQALDAVLGGNADLATVADLPLALAVLKGYKPSIICTQHSMPKMYGIVVRKDQGISSPKDLHGKKIGITAGTNTMYALDSFLLFHGIPRDNIKLIDMPSDQIGDAVRKGNIQAGVLWEPLLSDVVSYLGTNAVTFYGDERRMYRMTWNVAGMEEFAHNKPEIIKGLLRAYLKADAFIRVNPQEARQITARHLAVSDSSTYDEFWKSFTPDVSLSPLLIENMENPKRWAMTYKVTHRKDMPNYLRHVYFDGLKFVKPAAVTIVH